MKKDKMRIATCRQEWFGFSLVRGHAFGRYNGVCYVSGGEPCPRFKGNIIVYQHSQTANSHRWRKASVHVESDIGRVIIDALTRSPYDGVDFQEERFDVSTNWKPMPGNYRPADRRVHRGKRMTEDQCRNNAAIERRLAGAKCFYDDTPWRPGFPTFRDHRPDTTPKLREEKAGRAMPAQYDVDGHVAHAETVCIWAAAMEAYKAGTAERREKYERSHARFLQMQAKA